MIAVAALVCAVAALVAREVAWSWQPLLVFAAAAHQLLWAAPVAVVLFAGMRRWRALVAAVCVLALAVCSQLGLYVSSDAGSGPSLRVLQANLKIGSADPGDLVATVRRDRVDVAMTEELTPTERDKLVQSGLDALLPYRLDASLAGGGGGLAIWSRYPLTEEVNYPGFQLGVRSARVEVSGRSVALAAVHLLPPYPYPSGEWRAEIGRVRGVLDRLAGAGTPVVVAGDFNATTDSAQYRALLRDGFRDGTDQSGAGYLPTYPTDRWFGPVLAIDHVLTRGAGVAALSSLALSGSDHRALLARVVT